MPGGALKPEQAAELALGARLRAYAFDRYKTKRKEGEERAAKAAGHDRGRQRRGGAEGVGAARRRSPTAWCMARDLVNEPANVLYPEEFARRAVALKKLGVARRGARRARR